MPRLVLAFAALAVVAATGPAQGQARWRGRDGPPPSDAGMERRREQDAALAGVRAGQVPLRDIEARIVPRMAGADYLGPEYDAGSGIYRLKFMRAGSVIWIDVNARNGAVIGRSGY